MGIFDNIASRFGYRRSIDHVPESPSNKSDNAITTNASKKVLSSTGGMFTTVIYPGWHSQSGSTAYGLDWSGNKDSKTGVDWQVQQYKGLIYDAIQRIANPVATSKYMIVDKDDEPVIDHPFLSVLDLPLGQEAYRDGFSITKRDLFYTLAVDLLLFGNALWLVNDLKNPSQLLPISPQKITTRIGKNGFVTEYIWCENTPSQVVYPAQNIVHFQFIDPQYGPNYYQRLRWGKSPIEAHSTLVELNDKMNTLIDDTMDKLGLPTVLAEVDGSKAGADKATIERIREDMTNRFFGKKDKVAVINAELMKITLLETKLKDLQFTESKELTAHEIAAMFGIDPMMLGYNQNTNRAQAESAIYFFQRFTLLPFLEKIAAQLNKDLIVPVYGDGFEFKFIEVVDENVEQMRLDYQTGFSMGAITPNEYRSGYMNLEPIDDPAMDKTYIPMGIIPVSGEIGALNQQANGDEEIEIEDDDAYVDIIDDDADDETAEVDNSKTYIEIIENEPIIIHKITTEELQRNRRKFQGLLRSAFLANEKNYKKNLDVIFDRQMDEVSRRLRSIESKWFEKRDARRADLDFILFDVKTETGKTITQMTAPIEQMLLFTTQQQINALELPIDFETASESVLKLLETGGRPRGVFKFAQEITKTTDENLRKTLLAGIRGGETIQQISDRIEAVKADAIGYRAVRIARTEINGGYNRAAQETVKSTVDEVGGRPVKFWYTAGPAERDTHNMNEQESMQMNGLPIDQPFAANGLQMPGDPDGDASEIINCRCSLGLIIEGLGT